MDRNSGNEALPLIEYCLHTILAENFHFFSFSYSPSTSNPHKTELYFCEKEHSTKRKSPTEGCHGDELAFKKACLNNLNLLREPVAQPKDKGRTKIADTACKKTKQNKKTL